MLDQQELRIRKSIDKNVGALRNKIQQFKNAMMNLQTRTSRLEDVYSTVVKTTSDLQKKLSDIHDNLEVKLDKLEGFSRRDNLRFFGIVECGPDNYDACASLAIAVLNDCDIEGRVWDRSHIVRAHRLGVKRTQKSNVRHHGKPRPMIVKFTHWSDKMLVLTKGREQLKRKGVAVAGDLTDRQQSIINQYRANGVKAYYIGKRLVVGDVLHTRQYNTYNKGRHHNTHVNIGGSGSATTERSDSANFTEGVSCYYTDGRQQQDWRTQRRQRQRQQQRQRRQQRQQQHGVSAKQPEWSATQGRRHGCGEQDLGPRCYNPYQVLDDPDWGGDWREDLRPGTKGDDSDCSSSSSLSDVRPVVPGNLYSEAVTLSSLSPSTIPPLSHQPSQTPLPSKTPLPSQTPLPSLASCLPAASDDSDHGPTSAVAAVATEETCKGLESTALVTQAGGGDGAGCAPGDAANRGSQAEGGVTEERGGDFQATNPDLQREQPPPPVPSSQASLSTPVAASEDSSDVAGAVSISVDGATNADSVPLAGVGSPERESGDKCATPGDSQSDINKQACRLTVVISRLENCNLAHQPSMDDEPEILNVVEQIIPENKKTRALFSREYRDIMRMLYQKLLSQFYCVPPVHFNNVIRQPYEHAQKKPRSKTRANPTPTVHVQAESKLETVKADDAQQRTLCALTALTKRFTGPGFILSNLKFSDYLNYTPHKKASQAVAGRPRPSDLDQHGKPKSTDTTTKSGQKQKTVEGDWDVLIFQPDGLGIVLLEIKSVGEGSDTNMAAEYDPLQMAKERVIQGLNQLDKGCRVISHIVSDLLPHVKVLRCLVLPNVRRDSLRQILTTLRPADLNKLGVDVAEVGMDCCLCTEDLPARGEYGDVPEAILHRLREWWSNMKRQLSAEDPVIDKPTYEHIVARFCGPLTTVRLYDPKKKLREVRTLRQTTSLIADHFAAIVLTQHQVEVLDDSTPQHVHITGAPGTGKSVLLQCKAMKWLQHKQPVVVVVGSVESAYISHHIYEALSKKGKLVTLFTACEKGASFEKHVQDVHSKHPSKPVLVIFDEFVGKVLHNNHLDPTELCVWSASAWVGECPEHEHEAYKRVHLDRVMRSPPSVQNLLRILQRTVTRRGTPCKMPVNPPCPPDLLPPPTFGLEVKLLSHTKHQTTDIWDCKDCGKQLARFLQDDLQFGLSSEMRDYCGRGESALEYCDILVLSAKLGWEAVNTNHEVPFVRALKKEATRKNPEIQVEFANPTRSKKSHKFPRENRIVFASCDSVRGWESKVVVFVPHRGAQGTSDCTELGEVVNGAGPHDDEASRSISPMESEDSATASTDSGQVEIAGISEDVKKAVATLSHASQEDAYAAISGTIALAVLFHF